MWVYSRMVSPNHLSIGCHTSYTLNYALKRDPDGVRRRHYYHSPPDVIQVTAHTIVHISLAHFFKMQMLHAQ
jgi:hypothetical protein